MYNQWLSGGFLFEPELSPKGSKKMELFFNPRTVSLIGASGTPMRPGNQLFKNMEICFGDNFYPVNPKSEEIEGKRCWPTIMDVPEEIDTAVVFIPAASVPHALEQCAEKGIKRVIIESGGFSETGDEGRRLEERCLATAREAGMRLWGPNCMGCIDVIHTRVLSFLMPMMWQGVFQPGTASLVVQSGMMSAGFLAQILTRTPFGLSKVASIGNKADVDETDVLEYLIEDPDTEVIGFYLESLARGRRFFELARDTDKKVVVLKAGRTGLGALAAASHTAAMAQDDRVLDSALRQAGVIRVHGMQELMDVVRSLSLVNSKHSERPRVGVISFSGGAGVVTSDELAQRGMELARLSDEAKEAIRSVFPHWMEPENPVDIYPAIEKNGPGKSFKVSLEALMKDPGVDAVYAHLFAPPFKVPLFDYDHIARMVSEHKKPLVVWVMGHADSYKAYYQELSNRGVPVVDEISEGVRILSALTMRR